MAETDPASTLDQAPLRGIHTASFAQILDQLGFSLAVTTYQAGKLVLLRPEKTPAGPVVNTHFRTFKRPMGFAYERGRFAIGTACEIREFHDMPDPPRAADDPDQSPLIQGAFLPRLCHTTGDIAIHEMVWLPASPRSELWFINTRFSCLATRSDDFSFVPRWHPPFITALAPEDRCHLNGMCIRDGQVRYVTALGETDSAQGWRANKKSGGILMDIASGEIVVRGLSMPHSPRWHEGKLWLLESGNGGLGTIDPGTGTYTQIARLPGFTRGLDFAGPYAFVGLSQVRETATFSGIAIADQPQDQRCCGVWIVDIRTAKVVGYLKFTDAVQEIFAVRILTGLRWPDVFDEQDKRPASTFKLPDEALNRLPPNLRKSR